MNMGSLISVAVVVILILLVLVLLISNIHIVQQSRAYVVERLGAFYTVWNVGLHLKIPFIMRVAKKVSLKEQVADFAPQPVITKDNVTMQIDTVIYFQITDPKLYTYGVEHPMNAIENLTATTLRNIIGDMELDQSLTSRDTINTRMRAILDEATDPWGIKVNRVELKNILPPREIQNAMEKQMKAERERRESILQAEGEKASKILVAEGEKQSAILKADAAKQARIMAAEAEATSIMKVQQALADAMRMLNENAPNDQVIKLKSLEALQKMLDAIPTTHKVYINTTFPVQTGFYTAEEMLDFTRRNRDKITCMNISRHLVKYVEESPDQVLGQIACPTRINCVLYKKYPAEKLPQYVERFLPYGIPIQFRYDYTETTPENLYDQDHDPILRDLKRLFTYRGLDGCRMRNGFHFEYKGLHMTYHKTLPYSTIVETGDDGVTYDILYDILIKQNGEIHSDWTGVKMDVEKYRRVTFEPYDLRVLEGAVDF